MAEIMSESQLKQAKQLIRRLCANYDSGRCLILDSLCPQCFSYTLLCKYFREAVLPEDKNLTMAIYGEPVVRRCVVCGRPLQAKSNRAKYCLKCAALVHKEQKAKSIRKRRANVDK